MKVLVGIPANAVNGRVSTADLIKWACVFLVFNTRPRPRPKVYVHLPLLLGDVLGRFNNKIKKKTSEKPKKKKTSPKTIK